MKFEIGLRHIATRAKKEIQSLTVSMYSPFGAAFFVAGLDMMSAAPVYALIRLKFVSRLVVLNFDVVECRSNGEWRSRRDQ